MVWGASFWYEDQRHGAGAGSKIKETYGLTDAEMFDAYNRPFLDDAVADGKTIHFSHDPRLADPTSALHSEYEFMVSQPEYKFVRTSLTFERRVSP